MEGKYYRDNNIKKVAQLRVFSIGTAHSGDELVSNGLIKSFHIVYNIVIKFLNSYNDVPV